MIHVYDSICELNKCLLDFVWIRKRSRPADVEMRWCISSRSCPRHPPIRRRCTTTTRCPSNSVKSAAKSTMITWWVTSHHVATCMSITRVCSELRYYQNHILHLCIALNIWIWMMKCWKPWLIMFHHYSCLKSLALTVWLEFSVSPLKKCLHKWQVLNIF